MAPNKFKTLRKVNKLQKKLAGQICEYFQSKQWEEGTQLTASGLEKVLDASRTPIRSALLYLAELSLIDIVDGNSFFVKKLSQDDKRLIKELFFSEERKLFLSIAMDRISHNLEDNVTEAALMRRYNVDRNVLLSVLYELAKDGLIKNRPGHGWNFQVALNTREAFEESYNIRKLILANCLYEKTFHFDKELADQCRQRHQKLLDSLSPSSYEIATVSTEFYETIAKFSGNRFILMTIRQQNRIRWFLEYSFNWSNEPKIIISICNKHLNIIEAIENDELDLASRLLWVHLDESAKVNIDQR